jgi:hypothetical protein
MRLLTLRIRVCPVSGKSLTAELREKAGFEF